MPIGRFSRLSGIRLTAFPFDSPGDRADKQGMFNSDILSSESVQVAVGRVLIVEDDGLISLNMESTARELGALEVEVFGNPAAARCAAAHGAFDCAILDIFMGAEATFEIADTLAARGIPFLFCTGLGRQDIVERHRNRPLLTKPYGEADLKAAILALIAG
jgi:CheY-like chemotaxis protein